VSEGGARKGTVEKDRPYMEARFMLLSKSLSNKTGTTRIYFLLTGSKSDTPATAPAIPPRTTPPARTLSNRFLSEGETPGMAASATSGMTKVASTARVVGTARSCFFSDALQPGRETSARRVRSSTTIRPTLPCHERPSTHTLD